MDRCGNEGLRGIFAVVGGNLGAGLTDASHFRDNSSCRADFDITATTCKIDVRSKCPLFDMQFLRTRSEPSEHSLAIKHTVSSYSRCRL